MTKNLKPVCVHFANPDITALFSELFECHGVKTVKYTKVSEIPVSLPLVTEPMILNSLSKASERICLLVGDRDSLKGHNSITIEQPLTVPKIERSIRNFIENLK